MSDQLVYVFGGESRIHVAVRHDGALLTNERCNLDDIPDEGRVWVESLDIPELTMQAEPATVTS